MKKHEPLLARFPRTLSWKAPPADGRDVVLCLNPERFRHKENLRNGSPSYSCPSPRRGCDSRSSTSCAFRQSQAPIDSTQPGARGSARWRAARVCGHRRPPRFSPSRQQRWRASAPSVRLKFQLSVRYAVRTFRIADPRTRRSRSSLAAARRSRTRLCAPERYWHTLAQVGVAKTGDVHRDSFVPLVARLESSAEARGRTSSILERCRPGERHRNAGSLESTSNWRSCTEPW